MATRKAATPKPAAKSAEPRGRGRPTKLMPEMIRQAGLLCQRGLTDQEIADFFEVSVRTIARWKNDSDEFCQALKVGKDPADDRVERSLYAVANGYEHDEIDIRVVDKRIVKTTIRKHYPPNPVACFMWLKNRRPGQWRQTPPEGDEGDEPAKTTVVFEIRDGRKHAQPESPPG